MSSAAADSAIASRTIRSIECDSFASLDPSLPSSLDRSATARLGDEGIASGDSGPLAAGDSGKERAAAIIESIGRDFVALRQKGRSPAWAELEDRLMASAHILISAGMMSTKDWIGIARDIEEFRKQEQRTQTLPADFIAAWLSTPEPEPEPTPVAHRKVSKPLKVTKKSATKSAVKKKKKAPHVSA